MKHREQESPTIAKMTERCAQCRGALKMFGDFPTTPMATFPKIFKSEKNIRK